MAKVLTLLFEITGLFDMRTRTELVMLQKTMVVVEGVARSLDPRLDMWSTAEPVVRAWITRNLGPIGKIEDASRSAMSLLGTLAQLPALSARAETLAIELAEASRSGFTLDPATIAAIGRAERRGNAWIAGALWVLAGLAALAVFG
jgi:ubiquinone biosynthesis protein